MQAVVENITLHLQNVQKRKKKKSEILKSKYKQFANVPTDFPSLPSQNANPQPPPSLPMPGSLYEPVSHLKLHLHLS